MNRFAKIAALIAALMVVGSVALAAPQQRYEEHQVLEVNNALCHVETIRHGVWLWDLFQAYGPAIYSAYTFSELKPHWRDFEVVTQLFTSATTGVNLQGTLRDGDQACVPVDMYAANMHLRLVHDEELRTTAEQERDGFLLQLAQAHDVITSLTASLIKSGVLNEVLAIFCLGFLVVALSLAGHLGWVRLVVPVFGKLASPWYETPDGWRRRSTA